MSGQSHLKVEQYFVKSSNDSPPAHFVTHPLYLRKEGEVNKNCVGLFLQKNFAKHIY